MEYNKSSRMMKKNLCITIPFYLALFGYLFLDSVLIHGSDISSMITLGMFFSVSVVLQLLCLKSNQLAEKVVLTIGISFAIIVVVSYIEIALGHTFFYSAWTGSERYRNGILRAGSTVSDPNNICYMVLPVLFLLETSSFKAVFGKYTTRILDILFLGAILLSSSRAGLVALIVCVFIYVFVRRKLILLLTVPGLIFAANSILTIYENWLGLYSSSTNYRRYIVEQGLLRWKDNKILGCGLQETVDVLNNGSSNTMNTYIYMLVGFGVIGLVLYCALIFLLGKKDILLWFRSEKVDRDCILRICALCSMCIIAYSLDTLFLALIWVLPAIFTISNIKSDGTVVPVNRG